MGAKFAPSMANLFMARWEEDVIHSRPWPELILWRRHINEVLLIWHGDQCSLVEFLVFLNDNNRDIQLQYEFSKTGINFLDLSIRISEGTIIASTYFMETDRKGFISANSSHHPAWLKSIHISQFLRLKHNCTNHEDFLSEADILGARFLEKGYDPLVLNQALESASMKNRNDLLVPRLFYPPKCD